MATRTPTGSNGNSKKPPALSQQKLQEGYERIHMLWAILAGILGCVASWHYAFSLVELNVFTQVGLAVAYNCGIAISDMSIYYLIQAIKGMELTKTDMWVARITKFWCLIDVTVGMIAHGSPQVAEFYFTWGLAVFTFGVFVGWGWLFEGSTRMKAAIESAWIAIQAWLEENRDKREALLEQRAKNREARILAHYKRQGRIAFAHRIGKRMIFKIRYSPFKSWRVGQVVDKQIDELFKSALHLEQQNQKALAHDPLHGFSIGWNENAGGDGAAPKKSKSRRSRKQKCAGCGAQLPKEFNGNPWNSQYCPTTNLASPNYGKPKAGCKTKKSRATA